ncbi:MAG: hypothetical protein M0Z36_12055, partial [Thermaerobacter sp.]|nr:hypothetical protein [Thermaerobacter sp.]
MDTKTEEVLCVTDSVRAVAIEPGQERRVVFLKQPIEWERILRWKAERLAFGELSGIKGYVYGVEVTFVDGGPTAERPANVRYPLGNHPWTNPSPDWEILCGPVIVTGSRPVKDGGTESVSLSDDELAWVL